MVNTDDFIKRLELILDYYSLSASGFADKIGVQRSSMSHLLSGRNKPSLDFILKIISIFPEVDLYWILNGKGNFPKTVITNIPNLDFQKKENSSSPVLENKNQENLFSEQNIEIHENPIFENKIIENKNTAFSSSNENESKIEKIVIFFKNGTFSEYSPK